MPGKPGGLRLRRGAKPPFSFRLRRKEKALFDGVKRKDAGGGIPGFARNARSACYGGLARQKFVGLDHSTQYGSCKSKGPTRMLFCFSFAAAVWKLWEIGAGALPDTSCFSFAAALWQLRETGIGGAPGYLLLLFCCRSLAVVGDWH